MLRFLIIAVIICLMCRWAVGKWPWDYLRGPSVRQKAVTQARDLLGVESGATRDEVIAAHRRLTALVHPDRGGTTAAMQEANAARDLLLAQLPGGGSEPGSGDPPASAQD
jgi:DnaJ homolog subfamily C member 19